MNIDNGFRVENSSIVLFFLMSSPRCSVSFVYIPYDNCKIYIVFKALSPHLNKYLLALCEFWIQMRPKLTIAQSHLYNYKTACSDINPSLFLLSFVFSFFNLYFNLVCNWLFFLARFFLKFMNAQFICTEKFIEMYIGFLRIKILFYKILYIYFLFLWVRNLCHLEHI